jgi:NAD(P)-dependent dehydrogenase (short-subunit alcohol dehydrogenase family)
MSTRIALIGRSDLAEAFEKAHADHEYTKFYRPEFDITVKHDCDRIVEQAQADVYLISAGLYHGDAWTLWITNCVGPSYLAQRLYETKHQAHVIVISSLGSRWTSWPGIPDHRLTYNSAKHAVSAFAEALYQSGTSENRITVIEPGRFQSRLNDHTGMPIDRVVQVIDQVIHSDSDVNTVNVQIAYHPHRNNQPGEQHGN